MFSLQPTHYTVTMSQIFLKFITDLSEAKHFRSFQKLSCVFCFCYGIIHRLCLRLLDRVQTETNQIRDNQIQTERNQKSETVCTLQNLFSQQVRQIEERERVVLERGNPCNDGGAVAQTDELTLAKVMWESWASQEMRPELPRPSATR